MKEILKTIEKKQFKTQETNTDVELTHNILQELREASSKYCTNNLLRHLSVIRKGYPNHYLDDE